MLGARIDTIQPQIRNLITYLLPLPDKLWLNEIIGADWTETIVKHDQKIFYKVLSFVVMDASEDFLHLTNMSCMK